jgi:HD-like signal output (HDOD) protein/DNA-binding NarL/FixJ family response regulator
MKTILIISDLPIFRDTMSIALRLQGYGTGTVAGAREALLQIAQQSPDLVLLDLGTPLAEGLSVLTTVRSDPKTRELPLILLTSTEDRPKLPPAGKLGACEYLVKSSCSLADLTEAIRRRLGPGIAQSEALNRVATESVAAGKADLPTTPATGAPAVGISLATGPRPTPQPTPLTAVNSGCAIPQLFKREACIARATEAMEGRTLSGVIAQVIAMAMSPRMEVAQLATLISRDPVLSSKVLRVANSAIYASRGGPKSTIAEAIRNIGANTVRDLAAMTGIFETMPETSSDGFNPIHCWQHSFAVARLAEHFAAIQQPENAGAAYVVGLCHDLAEIIFHAQFAHEYAQILVWETRTGKTRRDIEKAMLGIEQSDLIVAILKQIGLPETIHGPIEAFHRGSAGIRSDANGKMARILRLADLHANGLLLASSTHALVSPITAADCKLAVGEENPTALDGQVLRNEVIGMAAALARFSAMEEAKLMSPLYSTSNRRVCLVRAAALSTCDPLETALASIAKLTVAERIPSGAQLRNFESLVIAAPGIAAPGITAANLSPADLEVLRTQCREAGVNLVWQLRSLDNFTPAPGDKMLRWPTTLDRLAVAIGVPESTPQQKAA